MVLFRFGWTGPFLFNAFILTYTAAKPQENALFSFSYLKIVISQAS